MRLGTSSGSHSEFRRLRGRAHHLLGGSTITGSPARADATIRPGDPGARRADVFFPRSSRIDLLLSCVVIPPVLPPATLERIASALIELGLGIRELSHADGHGEGGGLEAVESLWNRLGLETQKFLYELAVDFSPADGPFDLAAVASRLGMRPESARARLMTVGRSLRAMEGSGPRLWTSERSPETRRRSYTWNPDAHDAVIRLVEG